MRKLLFPALMMMMMIFSFPEKKKITIWLCGDSTMSIKEKKAYPETGWGMPFVYFWDTTVKVENLAKNGRSTKTFISEKLWQKVIDNANEGDYVFIQFGHNDEAKDKGERYATPDTFRMNLTKFVVDARAKKAIPVLITPVSRRRFDNDGKALETHVEYSAYVKEVAEKEKVLFIDLDTKSRELYQQFGKETSKLLFLQLRSGEHPNYPDGREDNTHFNELGARLIAQIILSEIRKQIPELAERVIKPVVK
jgi:lysophospholipase L1-like esterase